MSNRTKKLLLVTVSCVLLIASVVMFAAKVSVNVLYGTLVIACGSALQACTIDLG